MTSPGSQFGPYEIVTRLGAGGMGEVYRARDTRLRRDVALKVLAAEHSGRADSSARLIREARLVAALSHPNILTLHDVGTHEGQVYLVSELVEGPTLRDRIASGRLSVRETIDIARGVAAGLTAAHARNIVHRDIKPENVICPPGGPPKILDFGVARFVPHPDANTTLGDSSTLRTDAGAAVGTIAYMAPEQLGGADVDHRADQWAFGVMLQELLTGERPFLRPTVHANIAAILRDDPPSLASLRPDLPAALTRIVTRCLSKDPSGRYASTADLLLALDDVRAEAAAPASSLQAQGAAPARPVTTWRYVGWAAVVIAAIAVTFVATRERRPAPVAGRVDGSQTVAVLPFSTIGDGETYLAEGITESVTRALGGVEGTRVIASNAAFALARRGGSYRDIGRELQAGLLARGSVQRAGDRIRISAALIDPATDVTLWSDRYDRALTDILAVEDEIAWQIATRMAAAVGRPAPDRPSMASSTTPEAYDAYLRARARLRARFSTRKEAEAAMAEAIADLERAIALDDRFALAHATLASAYTQQFFYFSPDPSVEQKAFVEVEKALALNPDLAEAYLARAQLVWNVRNGFQHERAVADLHRAIAANPNLAEAHTELGKIYYHLGLTDKAVAANEEATRLDPLAIAAAGRRLAALIDAADTTRVREVVEASPAWLAGQNRASALLVLGDVSGAVRIVTGDRPSPIDAATMRAMGMDAAAFAAMLMARADRPAEAELALSVAMPQAVNPTGLSDIHHAQLCIGAALAQLGRRDEAVEWLVRAVNEGYPSYPRFTNDPALASLRDHPGFAALLERLRRDHERWLKIL